MESSILIDTSILIALQRGEEKTVALFSKYIKAIYISQITACEFIYGSQNSKEKCINKDFLNQFNIVEVTEEISRIAYHILDRVIVFLIDWVLQIRLSLQ